jgi:hypothetical protein
VQQCEHSQKASAERAESIGAAHRLQVSVQLIHQRHSTWHCDLFQASIANVVKALQHGSVEKRSAYIAITRVRDCQVLQAAANALKLRDYWCCAISVICGERAEQCAMLVCTSVYVPDDIAVCYNQHSLAAPECRSNLFLPQPPSTCLRVFQALSVSTAAPAVRDVSLC